MPAEHFKQGCGSSCSIRNVHCWRYRRACRFTGSHGGNFDDTGSRWSGARPVSWAANPAIAKASRCCLRRLATRSVESTLPDSVPALHEPNREIDIVSSGRTETRCPKSSRSKVRAWIRPANETVEGAICVSTDDISDARQHVVEMLVCMSEPRSSESTYSGLA